MREGAAEARARKVDLMLSPLSVSRDLSRGAMRVDEVQERRTPSLPAARLGLPLISAPIPTDAQLDRSLGQDRLEA